MAAKNTKRRYNSTRRQQQARETRRQIIAAARELFFDGGYAGTTVEGIAGRAGVAPETVYAAFGSKLALLTALVDQSIVGDDDPLPLLERPEIRAAEKISDPHMLLHKFAADITRILQRVGPLFSLLQATAQSEPEIADLLDKLLRQRRLGMQYLVGNLQRMGGLRPQLDPDQAAETVWLISSAEVYNLYVGHAGQTEEHYRDWLEKTLNRLLLP